MALVCAFKRKFLSRYLTLTFSERMLPDKLLVVSHKEKCQRCGITLLATAVRETKKHSKHPKACTHNPPRRRGKLEVKSSAVTEEWETTRGKVERWRVEGRWKTVRTTGKN